MMYHFERSQLITKGLYESLKVAYVQGKIFTGGKW